MVKAKYYDFKKMGFLIINPNNAVVLVSDSEIMGLPGPNRIIIRSEEGPLSYSQVSSLNRKVDRIFDISATGIIKKIFSFKSSS